MSRIIFKGRLDTFTGFGQQFCHLIQFCIRSGYEVLVIPVSINEAFTSTIPPEIKSRIGKGSISGSCFWKATHLEGNKTGDKNMIYSTVWETDHVLAASVRSLNAAKCVVVPSEWCAEAAERSGITVPVRVVPHGLDKSIYHYHAQMGSGPCVFGTAGRLMHGPKRKGLAQVVEAFLLAFPGDEDVRLKIKTFADDKLDVPDDPRIEKTIRYLSEPDVAGWLASLTCFVSAARAEGWGLWQHQSLAVGRPVICPRYGGVNMFLTENNSYPVEFGLVQSGQDSNETGNWCNPFTDSLVEQMRRVHQNRAEAAAKGRAGSIETSDFTVERSCLEAIKVMEEFGGLASSSVTVHSDEVNSKSSKGSVSIVRLKPFITSPQMKEVKYPIPPATPKRPGSMRQELSFRGWINTYTGFGQQFCQLIKLFIKLGFDVKIRANHADESFSSFVPQEIKNCMVEATETSEWEYHMLPILTLHVPTRNAILSTMWETNKLRPESVSDLNKYQGIIVPCRWNADTFRDCGVTVPIRIVPLGINKNIYFYNAPIAQDECVFGCAGRLGHGYVRKGIGKVINAFKTAFPSEKDVILKVKCFQDDKITGDSDSRIQLIKDFMTEAQVADWLSSLTCFVSAATGEGWGLWQHQALAVGRPVIGCNYGGMAEFMTPENSYALAYEEGDGSEHHQGAGQWAVPTMDSLVAQMRRVYENRSESENKGIQGSISTAHLTQERCALGVLEVMQEFGMVKSGGL